MKKHLRTVVFALLAGLLATNSIANISQLGWGGGNNQRNTVKSLVEAVTVDGFRKVEVDLQYTTDYAVIMHDPLLEDETIDGTGDIRTMSFADVQHLTRPDGSPIETLTMYLDKAYELGVEEVFLDVRNTPPARVLSAILDSKFDISKISITLFNQYTHSLYLTFLPTVDYYIKSYELYSALDDTYLDQAVTDGFEGIAFQLTSTLPPRSLMDGVKTRNLKTFVFLGYTDWEVQALNHMGIDYIVMHSDYFPQPKIDIKSCITKQIAWGGTGQWNSVNQFNEAISRGNKGYFFADLRVSSDGVAYGYNPSQLSSLTNLSGATNAYTWSYLESNAVLYNGDSLSNLEQLLTVVKSVDGKIFLDIPAGVPGSSVAAAVVAANFNPVNVILVTDQSIREDYRVNFYPGVPIYLKKGNIATISDTTLALWKSLGYDGIFYDYQYSDPTHIQRIHNQGLDTLAWGIGTRSEVDDSNSDGNQYSLTTAGYHPFE